LRFVDSNVFIYHMADDPRYGKVATKIIEKIEEGEEVATSTLVISQVCGYLKWKKRADVIRTFLGFLSSIPNLVKIETTFNDFLQALMISAEHNLDWKIWDDILIAVQMKRLGISEVYSNDKDFDRIPGIKRIFMF